MLRRLLRKLLPPRGTHVYKIVIAKNGNSPITTKARYRSDAAAIEGANLLIQDQITVGTYIITAKVWRGRKCVWQVKGEEYEGDEPSLIERHLEVCGSD